MKADKKKNIMAAVIILFFVGLIFFFWEKGLWVAVGLIILGKFLAGLIPELDYGEDNTNLGQD